MHRPSSGPALMWAGTLLGGAIGVLGALIPGGGLYWFFHAPTPVFGLPLSVALIASGAVVRRIDHAAPRELTTEELTRLMREADALAGVKGGSREPEKRG